MREIDCGPVTNPDGSPTDFTLAMLGPGWRARLTPTIETSIVPVDASADARDENAKTAARDGIAGHTSDIRSPRERFLDDVLVDIQNEVIWSRPPYMTCAEADRELVNDRFERGILSRDERDELIRRLASL